MKLREGFLAVAFILASVSTGLACACMFSSPATGFDRAEAVFTGRVIKAGKSEWTVEVTRVWKGDVESEVILFDAHARTSCSTSGYKKGRSYLFLVNVENRSGITLYSPQVCNWGTRLRSTKVRFEDKGPARWIEDWVLMGHGEGSPPINRLQ